MNQVDYKELFRKIDTTVESIDRSEDISADLSRMVERIVEDFRDDLGLEGARIYVRRGSYYVLEAEYPVDRGHRGVRVGATYPPIQQLHRRGYVIHDADDPGVDPEFEGEIGVGSFAAIGIGERWEHLVAFSLRSYADRDDVVYTLNTIRHVIRLKFREERFQDRMEESRDIQMSLLPRATPQFGNYDVWSETVPAEEVGGDLYDYIRVSERVLGVGVADSSGHGMPAALQARDAITGLRMGVEERMRITATIEKLNRVVGLGTLASKFISLWYGEIETTGTLAYCNAGHVPPLLYQDGRFEELSTGGLLLGPNPDARYCRGFATLRPGAVLVAYTDGITEAQNDDGEMFEVSRLKAVITSRTWTSAQALVDEIFRAVREFSGSDAPADDQTVTAIVRAVSGDRE